MGYLLAGGLTAPSGSSSIWRTGRERPLRNIYYNHPNNYYSDVRHVFKTVYGYYLKACLLYHTYAVKHCETECMMAESPAHSNLQGLQKGESTAQLESHMTVHVRHWTAGLVRSAAGDCNNTPITSFTANQTTCLNRGALREEVRVTWGQPLAHLFHWWHAKCKHWRKISLGAN